MFAKLFDSPRYGQIVIIQAPAADVFQEMSDGQLGGEIRFFFRNPTDQGIEDFAAFFPDSDAGWAKWQEHFDELTLQTVEAYIDEMLLESQEMPAYVH